MIARRIISFITVILICLSLASCNDDREYDEAEVLSAARDLIERSLPINEILYGAGFEASDEGVGVYKKAKAESLAAYGYSTLTQLQDDIREIYSSSYADSILSSDVFSAIKVDDVIVGYTRYYQATDDDGNHTDIMVKSDYDYPLRNEYSFHEQMEVIGVDGEVITVRTLVTAKREDGHIKNVNLDIKLIEEESGWRLMTPTYVVYNEYTEIYDNLKK